MKYDVAFSGSSGNSVLVNGLLFDIGISAKKNDKMKDLIQSAEAIFVSHPHPDHLNMTTYRWVSDYFPFKKVIVNEQTAKAIKDRSPKYDHSNLIVVRDRDDLVMPNGTEIKIYLTKHEKDVGSTAYLGTTDSLETFMFATDFYDFDDLPQKDEVGGIDYCFVEANHDEQYAWYLKEIANLGGPALKPWILKSTGRHTSKQQALRYFSQNKSENGEFIPLHKSSRFYDMTDYQDELNRLMRGDL